MSFRSRFALIVLAMLVGCDRAAPPPPQDPLRQSLVGRWLSPTATTSAGLDLNDDSAFRYLFFAAGSKTPFIAAGEWTVDGKTIVGQVKSVENGTYLKAGATFLMGDVISVNATELKIRKTTGIEIYHRPADKG